MSDTFKCTDKNHFIPGLQLNEGYYYDLVRPLIEKEFTNLKYAAALIGHCSDVFGFDDYKSTDHVWGPRLQIFIEENSYIEEKTKLDNILKYKLPFEYKGFATNYKAVDGYFKNAYMQFIDKHPINHFIEIETVSGFFNRDIIINSDFGISFKEWLTYPIQNLYELTSGKVFYDGVGELSKARQALQFFPEEVLVLRLYILWKSINEEQAFIGRCIENNDRIGESLITNRIINKLMKICFYYEKNYYPYSKWFGSAFKKLDIASKVVPIIEKIISIEDYNSREKLLNELYVEIVHKHNSLGITDFVEPTIIDYYNRGYKGFDSDVVLEKLNQKKRWNDILDFELLSKIELFDESYFGCSYKTNKRIVETSMKWL